MAARTTHTTIQTHVSALHETALRKGVPAEVANEARAATMRAVGTDAGSPVLLRRRAEGYFWAVVRRRLVRHRTPTDAAARFVLAAVVDDLLASGRDTGAVWAEIERGWADKVPLGVLEEFRLRMCA